MSMFASLMICSVFNGVGDERIVVNPLDPFNKKDLAHNKQVMSDYTGTIFYASTDMFITMSMGLVMQIPMIRPSFIREQANKMYSPSAWYLGNYIVCVSNVLFYPLVVSTTSFFFLKFNDRSFSNYIEWVGLLVLQGFSGASFGFMFSALFENEMTAMLVNQFVITVLNFGGGTFANLGSGANWFVKLIGYVSPFRYSIELLLRCMLKGLWYLDQVCEFYEYTYKAKCVWICLGFALFFSVTSYLATIIKSRFL